MAEVHVLPGGRLSQNEPNLEVIEFVEAVLARCKSGETVAVAFVEVHEITSAVSTGHVGRQEYHRLNSGAARLSAGLAAEPSDYSSSDPNYA